MAPEIPAAGARAHKRRAGDGDSVTVAALSGELGYPAEAREVLRRLRSLSTRGDCRILVAEADGAVCGWLQAQAVTTLETGLRVEIQGLVVSGAVRRRGVGRDLVAAAEAWALELGAAAVVVRTNAKRLESQAFYGALGYAVSKSQVVFRKGLPG
jgi:GNAT superfamily N-acetyltransferase